jgi:deoxyuridine 5'-triphosphate nucleotidohydrolase
MVMNNYFETLNANNAYILGLLILNIKLTENKDGKTVLLNVYKTNGLEDFPSNEEDDLFINIGPEIIASICKHMNIDNLEKFLHIDITHFVKNNTKDVVTGFLRAYYEKFGKTRVEYGKTVCNLTVYKKEIALMFAEFFDIPYKYTVDFNLHRIEYTGVNIIDINGLIYNDVTNDMKKNEERYKEFLTLLGNERPCLKFTKISDDAVTPTKANFSDVGYDLTATGVHKKINAKTFLCKTGIKLDIPLSYYVEITPRSSIIRSGYMLANSTGIIDCSYKGELFIALIKVDDSAPDIEFPYRCCQLIMRKQIYPEIHEVSDIDVSKRGDGGFGSSG